jgi:hypothetical protein
MRTTVIHQPDFLPYLGFFHRFLIADVWVILDNVQFLRNSKSWHHRDKIKTLHGGKWLTVAIRKCSQFTPINEVLLADTDWREGHLNLVKSSYSNAPYFTEIMPHIDRLYQLKCERLVDFNLASIGMLNLLFDLSIDSVLASSLSPEGKGNELLVDLIKKVGADSYLSGVGARSYYDPLPFDKAGIKVFWQEFEPPVYPQLHGEFLPYLSSIDMLFNCGSEESCKILRSI